MHLFRVQSHAMAFADFLVRQDRERIRAMIGAPFYADDGLLNTEADLDRIFGPKAPLSGPPKPKPPGHENERLIGITVIPIEELRFTPMYRGDRGADLLRLAPNDYYVLMDFATARGQESFVVYVRWLESGQPQIAGFFD